MSWTCLGLSSFGSPLVLKVGIFSALLWFTGGVTSQGQMPLTTPTTGVVCISDCATCPVICSSPPPLSMPTYQPPLPPLPKLPSPPLPPLPTLPPPPLPVHHHHPPPESYYYSSPPPPSLEPLPLTPPGPPLPTLLPPPEAPSLYPSWSAPPPPFKYSNNAPSGPGIPGTGMGGHDYSYPYYYFYASEAASLAGHCYFFMLLLFFFFLVI
ncbi:hypothetical protein NL676_036079 [Syzygium grande]|nr:hypothetical protein NL676_036079 [Syzygium grande]